MAMAQGWHNLPALYGQKVRHVDPIKDFSSGVKEGAKVHTQLSLSKTSNSLSVSTTESLIFSLNRLMVFNVKVE